MHSEVGNTCTGAKVNGRIVQLKYMLRNGDVVDILTQAGHEPSKDWLAIVKTSRARNKIKHVINANERERAIEIGQKYLEKEARRLGFTLNRIQKANWSVWAGEYGLGKVEDLYAASATASFPRVRCCRNPRLNRFPRNRARSVIEPAPSQGYRQKDDDAVIKVHGVDDVMVYRAKCCNPIKGEAIVGYVTRGKGIAVHSKMCPNVQNLMYDSERKIEVDWARNASDSFPVRIVVHTDDRPGLLHQLTSVLSDENTNVRSLEAKADRTQ